jgi:hypothetical protein
MKVIRLRNSKDDHANTRLEEISVSMVMAGDFVIRLEDVEYSIGKMQNRVSTYRPNYGGRGRGRGNYRGPRGGRGSRGGGRGRTAPGPMPMAG